LFISLKHVNNQEKLELKTAGHLTEKEIEAYRNSLIFRQEQETRELKQRRERAWSLALKAAEMLKERFGAKKVVLFGSLARERMFTMWSDVDLAAWGLRPEDTFRAIGEVYDLDEDIRVNLVDVSACLSSFLETIEKDGVDI
jgi:uncharacterized protein